MEKWEKNNPRAAAWLKKQIEEISAANPEVKRKTEQDDYLINLKYCYCAYGFLPYEYVGYDLYSKTEDEYREYISNLEAAEDSYRMNDIKAMALFRDKGLTYDLFRDFFHRECIVIEKKRDFKRFREFVGRHPVFVQKLVNESCGKSVLMADLSDNQEDILHRFSTMIRTGKHIIEEIITQGREMAAFNMSSVNTVRCATILTKHGPEIVFCGLTAGRAGSFVNNGGAGGILVGIDKETGVLNTPGVDEYCFRYERHPDSGTAFMGYQLPEWDGLLQICRDAAVLAGTRGCRYVGWDMAYTERDGWIMVEGNGCGQLIGAQVPSQRGVRTIVEGLLDML